MSNSTEKSSRYKREFYARPEIARAYAEQRFGGASGEWVSERELQVVLSLLPLRFQRALDLGCGTGRLGQVLQTCGETVGLDASAAMLDLARRNERLSFVQGDAFALPFANAAFDVVVALRFAFHFQALEPLFDEIARVVAPNGAVIFDTYRWSVRAWLPLDAAHWGGGVFAHSPVQVERVAEQCGMRVASSVSCFLFSPYVYRRLPLAFVRLITRLEKTAPWLVRARTFWRLERIPDGLRVRPVSFSET